MLVRVSARAMAQESNAQALGGDMFQAMSTYVKDYKDAYAEASRIALPALEKVDNVVLTGMGGSGIGASLVEALLASSSPRPVVVVKDYHLPKWASGRTLVVATSYSGNTEETLSCVAEAQERGAMIAGIASGGHLTTYLGKNAKPLFKVPAERQPRAALPLLFGGLAGMLSGLGLGKLSLDPQDENILQNLHVQLQPKLSGTEDRALRLAEHIRHAQPTIVGEGHLWPVALRWKAQLNENSKMFSRAEPIPEMNHNDLVPWADAKKQQVDALLLLRRKKEPKEVATRFDFLADVARKQKVPIESIGADCKTPLGQCLEHLMLADYTSVYAAILRRIDPTPVPIIGDLKKRLERDGLAVEVRRRLGL
jgi:glucose/mannose-6-phosphate isomerase